MSKLTVKIRKTTSGVSFPYVLVLGDTGEMSVPFEEYQFEYCNQHLIQIVLTFKGVPVALLEPGLENTFLSALQATHKKPATCITCEDGICTAGCLAQPVPGASSAIPLVAGAKA